MISWWGNIRFEKSFSRKMTDLLAASGCIAVTGGLEVASNRLLKLMNKGVTVEQVARVTQAFSDSGILVHAYLSSYVKNFCNLSLGELFLFLNNQYH